MKPIQQLGIGMVILAVSIFTAMLFMGKYAIDSAKIAYDSEYHEHVIGKYTQPSQAPLSYFKAKAYISDILAKAQQEANETYDAARHTHEWNHKIGAWKIDSYTQNLLKSGYSGIVAQRPWLFFLGTFGLAIIGGFLYIIPLFRSHSGANWVDIRQHPATKGISHRLQSILIFGSWVIILVLGAYIGGGNLLTIGITVLASILIVYMVRRKDIPLIRRYMNTSSLAILLGAYLIGFYILLYWFPSIITPWTTMVSPLSTMLNGNPASQWFLYGLMYTIVVAVMGIRMLAKYKDNPYQKYRTLSVIFFQTVFAFLLPEILVRLNYPYYDFKNIWPLNYSFFFDYNLNSLIQSGSLGIFMLVWGLVLMIVGVPVLTYFYGKRWYCSWVCGCGGLAETLGDPFRQLSDKRLVAWKYERYIIHAVLVAAVLMTIGVLYTYFTGSYSLLGVSTDSVKQWYGFLIGSAFSGVVGTGFYPLMGNRVWCRYGCPLAAYLGIVQRFKSRFRITTNGGQCISCGNCSTYCEMGIDVRAYAQRGQNIVRSSCVGCGVCASVCPRGVLRLENTSPGSDRTSINSVIHIKEADVRILS